jgi:hypothetical protein
MQIDFIKKQIKAGYFRLSVHAEIEARYDQIGIRQIVEAILNDDVLEQYPDTGRGESCLILGFAGEIPIHVVCGVRGELIVIVTVYIPGPPKFLDPWTRGDV